eukprot:4075115-Amphidinium_carterae.1
MHDPTHNGGTCCLVHSQSLLSLLKDSALLYYWDPIQLAIAKVRTSKLLQVLVSSKCQQPEIWKNANAELKGYANLKDHASLRNFNFICSFLCGADKVLKFKRCGAFVTLARCLLAEVTQ